MIKIHFQDAKDGQQIDTVTHPAVPRVDETVFIAGIKGVVAHVVWIWSKEDLPCCYVGLKRVY